LRIAEGALAVARLSLPAAEMGNPHAVSDAGVAVILADAAAQSAALNVRINLAWIADQDFNQKTWSRIEAILSETAGLRDGVLALTYSKI
jgi:formiminotetrahydrofolate cyclodeaminase